MAESDLAKEPMQSLGEQLDVPVHRSTQPAAGPIRSVRNGDTIGAPMRGPESPEAAIESLCKRPSSLRRLRDAYAQKTMNMYWERHPEDTSD
jgi:hypothetical protein